MCGPHAGQHHVMGDQHQTEGRLVAQRVKQGDDVAFSVFIKVAGRLVGEQHAGTIDERPRDSYPSKFTAGQLGGISVHPLLQSHAYEQGRRVRIRMGDRHCPTEQCGQNDVVDRPKIRQQARKLEDEAELNNRSMLFAVVSSLRLPVSRACCRIFGQSTTSFCPHCCVGQCLSPMRMRTRRPCSYVWDCRRG